MSRSTLGLFVSVALCLGLAGCGGDDTSGGTGGGSTPASSGAGASGATGTGGAGQGGTGQGGTGQGGTGQGGTGQGGAGGGGSGDPTVTLTVNPDTIPAGGSTAATVSVTNFVLEAPQGQPNQTGHGHYHIYLDGASGGQYLVANQVPMVTLKIPATTKPGPHTLRVSLSDNHHIPLVPAVEEIIDITVQ